MFIHKSHSKKDLIEIIELFNIDIEHYEDLNKKENGFDKIPKGRVKELQKFSINYVSDLYKYFSGD